MVPAGSACILDDFSMPALDGTALRATLFENGDPKAAVIISSATAVPRAYYRAFAQGLADAGAAVLTYDYRGCGDSRSDLRRSTARMRDWGTLDFAGAIEFMAARYPTIPLHAVGHSVGGHVVLLAPNNARIARAVAIAAQSGYWRLYRGFERYRVYAFMRAIMPLSTRMFGYFPGRALRFGDDLAPGVLLEWSRWCTSPGYFFDDPSMTALENAKTFTAPTMMIGLSDDPWATPQAIDALQCGFTHAPVTRKEIDPHVAGLREIGHMGFFRSANATLWPRVVQFLGLVEPATKSPARL